MKTCTLKSYIPRPLHGFFLGTIKVLIPSSLLLITEGLSGILCLFIQTAADSYRLWAKFDGSCLLELRKWLVSQIKCHLKLVF